MNPKLYLSNSHLSDYKKTNKKKTPVNPELINTFLNPNYILDKKIFQFF